MASWNYSKLTPKDLVEKKSELQLPLSDIQKIVKYLSAWLLEPAFRRELQSFFQPITFQDFEQGIMIPENMRIITKEATGIILDHPVQLDINIAKVHENSTSKKHSHGDAIAIAKVLWNKHGYKDPVWWEIYNGEQWIIPEVWQEFIFEEDVKHGLKRTPEWKLTFLTVQSLTVNKERYGLWIDYKEILDTNT